jgi:hypothetical protein
MIKKSISFITMVAMVFGTMFTVSAQDDSKSYAMWESIMLTPDNKQLKTLGDNLRTHNATYHPEGTYQAFVYTINSGPNSGKLLWIMGPLTFADLDNNDDSWRDTVMPYVKKMGSVEYWRQDTENSNTDMLTGDPSTHPIQHIRYHEVARGHGYSVDHLLGQISTTVKAMDGENPWGVYDNQFRQGFDIGRHIATVGFYKNWAEYDDDGNFKETFIKTHGKNSWDPFIRGMADSFHNSWDEIWVYSAYMSGR